MLRFDDMTEDKLTRLAEVASSHGMSAEHLLAVAQGRPKFEQDVRVASVARGVAKPVSKIGKSFHFGESRVGFRRP